MKKLLAFPAACALSFAVVGCTSKPAGSASAGTPPAVGAEAVDADFPKSEWKDVSLKEFSVKLPTGWWELDFTSDQFESRIAALIAENAKFKDVAPMIRGMKSAGTMKLMAFNEKTFGSVFTDNLNVIISKSPTPITFEQVAKLNKDTMSAMSGGSPMDYSEVDIVGTKYARIKYTTPMNLPDGTTVSMHGIAFITEKDDQEVVFTFSASDKTAGEVEKMAEKAMRSVKLN